MIRNNNNNNNINSNYIIQPVMVAAQPQQQDPYGQFQNTYYVPYQQAPPHPVMIQQHQQYMMSPIMPIMPIQQQQQLYTQHQHKGIRTPPNRGSFATPHSTQLPSIQKVFNATVDSNQQSHIHMLTPNSSTSASSSVSSPSLQPIVLPPLGGAGAGAGYTTTTSTAAPMAQHIHKKNYPIVPQSNDFHTVKRHSQPLLKPKSVRNSTNNKPATDAQPRKRRRTTKEQRQILKDAFNKNKAPSKEERLMLASQCNMNEKSIQVWFQNQRQYMRREQNLRALQKFQIIH